MQVTHTNIQQTQMYNCFHSNQLFRCLFSTATNHFPTLCVNNNSYSLQDSPSLWNPSSCPHTTSASLLPKKVSQIVPQALSMQISTLPSLVPACTSSLPPSSLTSPSLQFQFWVEVAVRRIVFIWHATTDVLSSKKWHVYISKSNGSEGGSPFCFSQCNHLLYAYSCELHPRFSSVHRRLQSCVSTRARLRYAAFDAQWKRILSLHCTLYGRLCTHTLYAGDHVSSRPVLVIWVRIKTRAMPRYTRAWLISFLGPLPT